MAEQQLTDHQRRHLAHVYAALREYIVDELAFEGHPGFDAVDSSHEEFLEMFNTVYRVLTTAMFRVAQFIRGEFQSSSDKSSSWFPLTQNFAKSAIVRSTISFDFEIIIDLRLKQPNQ